MRTRRALPKSVTGLLVVAMIVVLGAVGAAPALALDTTTTGNAPLWFQFNVGSVGPDEKTSHVSVTLRDQALCGGGFQVFASGSWSYWGTPTEADWVGSATDIGYDMHMWASEMVPGAYYVRLGYGAKPGCVLGVSGQAVDYLGIVDLGWHLDETEEPAVAPMRVAAQPQVTVEEAPAVASVVAANTVASPAPQAATTAPTAPAIAAAPVEPAHHDMEMVPNMWMPVTNNEPMMFEFYVGNVPEEQSSEVSVTLFGAPFRAGRFEIFTAEGVPFDLPGHDDWFGKAIMVDGENPAWHGNLVPGAYYVLVYPEGMKNCLLAVSGPSITF